MRELGERGLGAREHRDSPGEVERLLGVEARHAGVRLVSRAEGTVGLPLLVVLVDLLDLEHGERHSLAVGQDDPVSLGRLVDGQADR